MANLVFAQALQLAKQLVDALGHDDRWWSWYVFR